MKRFYYDIDMAPRTENGHPLFAASRFNQASQVAALLPCNAGHCSATGRRLSAALAKTGCRNEDFSVPDR